MGSNDSAELIELERRRGAALMKTDLVALEKMFAEDLVHIHATGMVHSKSEILNYIRDVTEYVSVTRSNLKVRFYGDVAIMTGDMNNLLRRRNNSEQVKLDARVTQVWVKTPDGWKQSSFQATRLAPT